MTEPVDPEQLRREIEAAFAAADRTNVRQTAKTLARLIARVADPATKKRYEGALDAIEEMVKHGGGGED